MRKHQTGFTLLEISIVLIIFSIMVGSGFAIANRQAERKKEDVTREHLDKIEEALMAYRIGNNRLPCPADGSMNPDNASYGLEAANPDPNRATCTGGSPAANFTAADHVTKVDNISGAVIKTDVVGGMVPVVTLGLPEKYALDGYGNKISYHIDAQATENSAFSYYTASNGSCFNVVIDDEKTYPADGDVNYISFHAVYALISHGADGHGAFSQGGPRVNKGSTNTFQNFNAKMNASGATTTYTNQFFMVPASQSTTLTNRFDDSVRFKTRADLRTEQDSPAFDFPDLALTTGNSGSGPWQSYFYFRCKDRFILEPRELVDQAVRRNNEYRFSPNNEFVLTANTAGPFRVWTYDGKKMNPLPDSSFGAGYTSMATNNGFAAAWASDGSFFIVSGWKDAASLVGCNTAIALPTSDNNCGRIRLFERTGFNTFKERPAAFPNYRKPGDLRSIYWDEAITFALSPDDSEVLVVQTGSSFPRRMVLYKRNPDNTFTPVTDAFDVYPNDEDPCPPALEPGCYEAASRRPTWSPDGKFLIVGGVSLGTPVVFETKTPFFYRNDGNHHYSRVPRPVGSFNYVYAAAFSPNGRLMVNTDPSRRIRVYKLSSGDIWEPLPYDHFSGSGLTNDPVNNTLVAAGSFTYGTYVAWSPDGRYVALGRSATGNTVPSLFIFKVQGDRLTQLELPDGPDITPKDQHTYFVEFRQLMPWEKDTVK